MPFDYIYDITLNCTRNVKIKECVPCFLIGFLKVIARIVDGSEFDEFKTFYGETLVTGAFKVSFENIIIANSV